MEYTLSLTRQAAKILQDHLLHDRSREQMAVTLCGINCLHRDRRLLVRDVILLPPDAFKRQTSAQLELKSDVQAFIHRRAKQHGLIQVDWHSHPGSGPFLAFSHTDDRFESAQAVYLAHRMDGIPYGSVVVNDDALDARIWLTRSRRKKAGRGGDEVVTYRPEAFPLQMVLTGDLTRRVPATVRRLRRARQAFISPIFDRQVRAFGEAFQRRLGTFRAGVVGVGGLGSALVENLSRMGVRHWVLVDDDVVDLSNLNRLVNATSGDAQKARPKVYVARSTIKQANPKSHVRALRADVFDPEAQRALKGCDLLIVATDNHSSRLLVNRLAVQYLIPLVHIGFNVSVEENANGAERKVTDVSGEFAIPDLGRWCLQCAGIVDPQQAGWELASPEQRAVLRQRGYVDDTPAPAVRHLDALTAGLAAAEIHNMVHAFRPLHRYMVYDAMRAELVQLRITPGDDCPVCSADHGILGLGDLEPLPDYRRSAKIELPPVPQPRHSLQLATPMPKIDPVRRNTANMPADL